MRTINRLLVANRGEIASRVFATCRRLGIETVAVYSDADADLPFAAEATLAVRLPGEAPSDTYLRGEAMIDAAARAGADAIHPGYGFLSENPDFAQAVIDAGLTWVGPSPDAIRAMGSKVGAKELMRTAGVPVLEAPSLPGEADLPLLVKASAGGGGRGMRIVRDLAALEAEVHAARAEAESAFGDGTVFVEPYVERGRHVEVQVWGDHRGENISILGARDCSVQRRHQKVVEEAPPPGVNEATLQAMYAAAHAAASAIGFSGAGTVEFLLDSSDPSVATDQAETARFWFLEMNTRLQVEHPVTEAITGVDLVELQIQAATDEPSPLSPYRGGDDGSTSTGVPEGRGHAVEVRVYAEDATFAPQSGLLIGFDFDSDAAFASPAQPGIRVDAGYASGSEVSTHYDAMLAKVIAWAPTRRQAVQRLINVLRGARIHGVRTNRDQLIQILTSDEFRDMTVSTTWLESVELPSGPEDPWLPTAAALALAAADGVARRVQQGIPLAWRNVVSQPQRTVVEQGDTEVSVEWFGTRDGLSVEGATVLEATPQRVRLEVDGVTRRYEVAQTRGGNSPTGGLTPRELWVDGPVVSARLREVPRFIDPAAQLQAGSLIAPMPGTVVRVVVTAGDEVSAGDPVLVLEAMKMQHTIAAPVDGRVAELLVVEGQQVAAGDVLAVVTDHLDDTGDTGETRTAENTDEGEPR